MGFVSSDDASAAMWSHNQGRGEKSFFIPTSTGTSCRSFSFSPMRTHQQPTSSRTGRRRSRLLPAFLTAAVAPFLIAAGEPVMGSADGTARTVCAPVVASTPLQKLELRITWPNAAKTVSAYEKLQQSLSVFYGTTSPFSSVVWGGGLWGGSTSAGGGAASSGGGGGFVPFTVSGDPQPRGLLCRLLYKHAHPLVAKLVSPFFCEDCHEGCAPVCVPYPVYANSTAREGGGRTGKTKAAAGASTAGARTAAASASSADFDDEELARVVPTHRACEINSPARCVFLESTTSMHPLPEGLDVHWEVSQDSMRLFLLVAGILCTQFSRPLGRSWIVHTVLGGLLGLGLFFVVVLWYVFRQTKNSLPFGSRAFATMNLLLVFAPTVGMYAWQSILPSFEMVRSIVLAIAQLQDPWYDFPVGAVLVVTAALGGVILGQKVFGSKSENSDDAVGDVPFTIASNGARIDLIPDEDGQNSARRALQYGICLFGVLAVLKSTTVPAMNLVILSILLTSSTIVHTWQTWRMAREVAAQADIHSSYISKADYERQTKEHTQRELDKLRAFLTTRDGRKHMTNVRNHTSELRVRQFAEGANHVEANLRADADEDGGSWWKFW